MYLCVVQMFITAKPAQLGFHPVKLPALSRTFLANFSMYLKAKNVTGGNFSGFIYQQQAC